MNCDDFTVSVNNGTEYVPLTASPGTPTVHRIERLIDTVDVDSIYPDIDAVRYINNDITATRIYERMLNGNFDGSLSHEECVIYTRERAQIIKILKREKNINTKQCAYVDDLVKELAEILEVHL